MAEKHVGKVLLAFLAGSAIGAIAGMLLAPLSGSETRQKIKGTSLDIKDKALEKVESVKTGATDLINRGKDIVGEIKSQVQAAVDAGKDAYTRKKDELITEAEEKLGAEAEKEQM